MSIDVVEVGVVVVSVVVVGVIVVLVSSGVVVDVEEVTVEISAGAGAA